MISNKKSLLFTLILGFSIVSHQTTKPFAWQIPTGIITAGLSYEKILVLIAMTPHIPEDLEIAYWGDVHADWAKNNLKYYTETLFSALGLGYATYKLYQSYKKNKKTSNHKGI